ncbi:hypothetical protein FB472_1168 [Rhodoglobus vestalii]|uniref:Uncharacterized protein n=1 Tax=Rhodoglobus vestalii TaxID=193384 RepID=A0A8H2K8G9_9MICO|nr:hypothetical protein [Rhodoglobus vestalii]TQO19601.1 hypothetical protein FB472_1168 [Rhodoglobus vestalii]
MNNLTIANFLQDPRPPSTDWPLEPLTWDGLATIIAAAIAALVVVAGYFLQQHFARRERRALIYSEALRAVADYLESPYLIRRKDGSAETRQRLVSHVSEIQSRIAFYTSLLRLHAPVKVNEAYDALVRLARDEAGRNMTAAWHEKPVRSGRFVPLGKGKEFDRSRSGIAMAVVLKAMGAR